MDNSVIYIMVGGVSRQTTKKDFYDYLLDVYPYQYNPEITQDYDFYDDAFDWLLSNIEDAIGIQIYTDDVLRINFNPLHSYYRCFFFDDAALVDESFNSELLNSIKAFCSA